MKSILTASFLPRFESYRLVNTILLTSLHFIELLKMTSLLQSLLTTTDSHLLVNVLLSLERIFGIAIANRVSIESQDQVRDAVDFLTAHPVVEIASISERLERLLNVYASLAFD